MTKQFALTGTTDAAVALIREIETHRTNVPEVASNPEERPQGALSKLVIPLSIRKWRGWTAATAG